MKPTSGKRGRPRLTLELLQARVRDYCSRYAAVPNADGLPPFPSGKRETRQHRAWLALYKAHDRLRRRGQGQCERCGSPVADGSVFCAEHRSSEDDAATAAAPSSDRGALLASQGGRCAACGQPLEALEAVELRTPPTARQPRLFHRRCRQLVRIARDLGPQGLARVQELLWPGARPPRRS